MTVTEKNVGFNAVDKGLKTILGNFIQYNWNFYLKHMHISNIKLF